jgi:MarR family transcriptional regulator, transcriptional regulator for hemolysin
MSDIRDIWLYANNILRSARQMVNEDLKPLNLSSSEGNILLHLITQNQGLRQEEIVEQLDISKAAVSRALDSLEKKSFITRGRDPYDKRASRVLITSKALEMGPQIEKVYNEVYAVAMQVVSEQELQHFIELFGRVSGSFSLARIKKSKGRAPN